ncbi:MAG: hypothetical protein CENE_00866 [Candidatus Celerinatantimonas neptuna]|nr:MAG: hypothetical protein CENE_00866 [Candidatus Celerinatantimonas neptuna]
MTNNLLSRKTKSIEYYRIFDIKTNVGRMVVESAACDGLGRNVEDAQEVRPIPNFTAPPEKPGRFKLVNPLAGLKLMHLLL